MRTKYFITTVVIAALLPSRGGAVEYSKEELAAVESHRAIKQLHLEYRGAYVNATGNERTFKREIWMDGKNLREDLIEPLAEDGTPSPNAVRESLVQTPELQCFWSDVVRGGGAGFPVTYHRLDQGAPVMGGVQMLDPRLFGLSPYSSFMLRQFGFEYVLLNPDRDATSVADVTYKDKPAREVKFTQASGVRVRLIFRDLAGWKPILIEKIGEHLKKPLVHRLEVEHAEIAPGKFFPKQLSYVRLHDGATIEKEVGSIEVKSIERVIDPNVFTLKGMDIAKGQRVISIPSTTGARQVWNGEQIVPIAARQKQDRAKGTSVGGFDLMAGIFAIVAMAAAYMAIRRIGNSPPSQARRTSPIVA